jgi:hypothetical protein
VVADKMTVLNRQSIARRYFRLAQAAWAAGDGDRALRYSEMAVQFDPTNRAAIDLRSAIWQGRPYGDHTLQPEGEAAAGPFGPSDVGPKVDALDRGAMPQWLLDQLQSPPGPPATLHPLDPGQPGRHRDIPRPERLQ